jgi:hypothetical protein
VVDAAERALAVYLEVKFSDGSTTVTASVGLVALHRSSSFSSSRIRDLNSMGRNSRYACTRFWRRCIIDELGIHVLSHAHVVGGLAHVREANDLPRVRE